MKERILFVDDEKFVLETFKRNLRMHFDIETADGPMSALKLLESTGPVAVIVSDLKMPRMNGVELLGTVKQRWPDTVRIMLTGQADIKTAVSAVNKGSIFRFLTKPCAPDELLAAVNDGLRQSRLILAERQLLHGTLRGCIQVLSELLAQVSPLAFGRSEKAKSLVAEMALVLHLDGGWKFELAAMLCLIGCISLPRDILERKLTGKELTAEEQQVFSMHPSIAGKLLRNIPRLEDIVEMIAEHEHPISANPCIGARMLKVALDFTEFEASSVSAKEGLLRLKGAPEIYDRRVVAALAEVIKRRTGSEIFGLSIHELREGMLLMEPVMSDKGVLLMDKGQTISYGALERFRNFGNILGVREPIYVLVGKEAELHSEQKKTD